MNPLIDLLAKYKISVRAGKPEISIESIESYIDFPLPEDYKYYLLHYSKFEDFIGPEFVRFWSIEELVEDNQGYGITDELADTIGIGSNGAGECIAIELVDEEYRVVLTPFIGLDDENHIEIGSSFTDFLSRLDSGKEWFKSNDSEE